MGDNFLKRQVENFKKGRDLAMNELDQLQLFNRPEVNRTVYTVIPRENCHLQKDEVLTVFASADGSSATLSRGHRKVGEVVGDGAQSLAHVLGERGTGGIANLQITEVSGISRVGRAVIVENGHR